MDKCKMGFKKIFLLMFAMSLGFVGNRAFSSDNVLQAIQVDGYKDSYNIILKSDDVAEIKKTVQAPNKMIINLQGIRASKTINTIYNNTSNVDSVVVEPIGEDSVKILIQADNAESANIHFDTLKTPLGVLDKAQNQNKAGDELVLNAPMSSYKPVYSDNSNEEDNGFSIAGASGSVAKHLKNIFKNEKISWMITFGLFTIIVLSGLKTIKAKDNEIRVGLSQSLKDREIDLYKRGINAELSERAVGDYADVPIHNPAGSSKNLTGVNFGLKAYQNSTRSPYLTPEMQRPRTAMAPAAASKLQPAVKSVSSNTALKNSMQNIAQQPAVRTEKNISRPKTTNIDSIKFLESMTKIYEKNGRSDLAQGLKANMKKAKVNLA